jgi:hypothetical protein
MTADERRILSMLVEDFRGIVGHFEAIREAVELESIGIAEEWAALLADLDDICGRLNRVMYQIQGGYVHE